MSIRVSNPAGTHDWHFTSAPGNSATSTNGAASVNNVSGVADGFATAVAHIFDAIKLPVGACVVGGGFFVETAFNTTTYAVMVGDATTNNRYLASGDRKALGYTALVPTEFVGTGEEIRLTITPTGSTATTGKATLRVLYTIRNRSNESSTT